MLRAHLRKNLQLRRAAIQYVPDILICRRYGDGAGRAVEHRGIAGVAGPRQSGWRFPVALCIGLSALVLIVYTAASAVVRPAMYGDSGFGFLVWDSMRHGAPFNRWVQPDARNIAHDVSEFFTTWSPGQYLLPGWLELLGIKLGLAIVLVDAAFSAAGLVGWFCLYRAFGFSDRTAAITVLIIACTRHFALPFGIYNGGEVLHFGTVPWFFLLVWRLRSFPLRAVPLLLGAGLLLIFMKLSGVVIAGCAFGAAAVSSGDSWFKRETLRRIALAAGIALAMGAIFYLAWFARGWNVLSSSRSIDWSKIGPYAAYVLFASWGSSISAGDLVNYIFFRPGAALLQSGTALYYAIVPVALTTFAVAWRRLRTGFGDYLRFSFLMAAAFGAVMVVIWSRGAEIDLQERYFRPFSMLVLVGFVHMFVEAPNRLVRALFGFGAILLSLYGLSSFVVHAREDLRHPLGNRGFRQHIASAATIDFLHSIDAVGPDGSRPMVLVPSPEIGLDLEHARVLAILPDFEDASLLRSRVYRGRVPLLYVVIQKRLVAEGKADIILRSFVDVPAESWRQRALDDRFVVYSAANKD